MFVESRNVWTKHWKWNESSSSLFLFITYFYPETKTNKNLSCENICRIWTEQNPLILYVFSLCLAPEVPQKLYLIGILIENWPSSTGKNQISNNMEPLLLILKDIFRWENRNQSIMALGFLSTLVCFLSHYLPGHERNYTCVSLSYFHDNISYHISGQGVFTRHEND